MDPLRTERLILRPWRPSDRPAFADLNSDPRVMEHFPGCLPRSQSDAIAERIEAHFTEWGWGLWAVEVPGEVEFAGFVGLSHPTWEASFTPCVEIGWRLSAATWGRGYATEAARAALRYGFETVGLGEVFSWTVPANVRSRRVMEKLGFRHDPARDFDHPKLPGHPLERHVFYALDRAAWARSRKRG